MGTDILTPYVNKINKIDKNAAWQRKRFPNRKEYFKIIKLIIKKGLCLKRQILRLRRIGISTYQALIKDLENKRKNLW